MVVTWCFTPSQPLRLYQGDGRRRSRRGGGGEEEEEEEGRGVGVGVGGTCYQISLIYEHVTKCQ